MDSATIPADKIAVGDYVIIQRQKYTKLHKFGNVDCTAMLGKDLIELANIQSQPYSQTFKIIPKEQSGAGNGAGGGRGRAGGRQRVNYLEPCSDVSSIAKEILENTESRGVDNRDICDDGESQSLKPEELIKLREEFKTSSEIVTHIVENSKTFASKTEYSQEKYLRKKEKKYFEYVQIRRPTLRLIIDVMFRQCADKILGLRIDSISQIVSYSGVCGIGNYLVYESGTNGLLPAALLNSIGAKTDGHLIHMHPGNVPQRQALLALNLPKEQTDRCISVNIYSILREYYQQQEQLTVVEQKIDALADDVEAETPAEDSNGGIKRKIDELDSTEDQPTKILKNDSKEIATKQPTEKQPWMLDNRNALEILKQHMDCLVVCAKEHPLSIIRALIPFVKPSRPVVVFSQSREILTELYIELKSTAEVTGLRLTSNWLRTLQILPNRTHPDVNMSGNSGFILCGYTIR